MVGADHCGHIPGNRSIDDIVVWCAHFRPGALTTRGCETWCMNNGYHQIYAVVQWDVCLQLEKIVNWMAHICCKYVNMIMLIYVSCWNPYTMQLEIFKAKCFRNFVWITFWNSSKFMETAKFTILENFLLYGNCSSADSQYWVMWPRRRVHMTTIGSLLYMQNWKTKLMNPTDFLSPQGMIW